ncbi:MAG: methyltransferase protein [Flavipsychrobacter sp.]|jgi:SAM-dependent methyltransferase|nr:methyltransferase protein [Flavipsychrobacter sp.]
MSKDTLSLPIDIFENDIAFNEIYPLKVRILANRHWTPIHITKIAVDFLGSNGGKVLDIGSGVGKFCLAGAYFSPNIEFTGVEQRQYLVEHALRAQRTLGLQNVSFIHGNFTQLNLRDYDHFYFFNSFYENIDDLDRIDQKIEYSEALFEYYVRYLYMALQQMPKGTKVATFHAFHGEIPIGYDLVGSHHNGDLNFWIKN